MDIIMSINPNWVSKILTGEKTIELRKSKPKNSSPFTVYIYETKSKGGRGMVVAEFTCDKIIPIHIFENSVIQDYNFNNLDRSCVPYEDIVAYIKTKGYGYSISDLIVYDVAKPLRNYLNSEGDFLDRPPQSWCYCL